MDIANDMQTKIGPILELKEYLADLVPGIYFPIENDAGEVDGEIVLCKVLKKLPCICMTDK